MIVAGESRSAYFLQEEETKIETHTLSVLVDNEPGVLARIVGLFSGRGYNIESLTVSEVEHERHVSRITLVTTATPQVLDQIKNHIARLVPVHRVIDLTRMGDAIERELALIKVAGTGEHRVEALRLAQAFDAKTVDATLESFVFELSGMPAEIDRFVKLMTSCGLVEVARTGLAALSRGKDGL
ncbi:acetolactate synthase small subunit [Methylobrevis pamukkalensis]|nr:acetolactate synthase small subunit [Methylobrevis pamukkalensis]